MSDVNWWLMALAFVLGLLLTLALTVRRVKREVPVYGALGRRPGDSGAAATLADRDDATTTLPRVDDDATTSLPKADEPTTKMPRVGSSGAAAAGAAAVGAGAIGAGAVGASKFGGGDTADEPYGAGSIRTTAGAAAPAGYTIKGNENSMLYHSPESPAYDQTVAEIWFRDAESAERAGFARWDFTDFGSHGGAAAGAAGAAGVAKLADTGESEAPKVVEESPFGAGSVRVSGAGTPPGYTVKGNEDSMLYHTEESPSYQQTIAEIWFRDVESAEKAGFARWDSGKSQRERK
ncbi:channel accessory protein ArfC, sunset domain variant [Mycolicibacterium sp. XJ870]